jgi:hypothetical protein
MNSHIKFGKVFSKEVDKFMVKLYMMDASEESQSFDLKNGAIYIGRSPDNDIQMKDKYVSRKHLKIHRKGDKYFIEDFKSANGTFVNGTQIPFGKEFEVKEGVAIGMSLICLGKGCLEGVMYFLDSIYFSEDISEESEVTIQNRPMTHKKNMELIYKVSNALMQSSNINEILEKILNYIFELLKRIDRGVIILIDEETGKISEVPSMPKKRSDDTMMMYSRSIVRRVLRRG